MPGHDFTAKTQSSSDLIERRWIEIIARAAMRHECDRDARAYNPYNKLTGPSHPYAWGYDTEQTFGFHSELSHYIIGLTHPSKKSGMQRYICRMTLYNVRLALHLNWKTVNRDNSASSHETWVWQIRACLQSVQQVDWAITPICLGIWHRTDIRFSFTAFALYYRIGAPLQDVWYIYIGNVSWGTELSAT